LATVSKRVAANDLEGVKSNLGEAIKLAAFLNIPATFGLIFLRYPIVQVLYERGRFLPAYTINTGDALLFYTLGLFSYSLVKIVTPTFYALGDTKTPVKFAAIVIAVKIAVNLLLIRHLGFIGLALGTSIASFLNAGLLLRALNKRIGSLQGHGIVNSLTRITIAALVMGVAASFTHSWASGAIGVSSLTTRITTLVVTIVVALSILFASSYMLKIPQARDFVNMFRRRFSKQ
ncbi:MAG TPA: lipid II flippase MurJ, partial [Acidobacteriota bacterium]|nr:lipid II flippase MurJ [Acidobacteriota bacterium]